MVASTTSGGISSSTIAVVSTAAVVGEVEVDGLVVVREDDVFTAVAADTDMVVVVVGETVDNVVVDSFFGAVTNPGVVIVGRVVRVEEVTGTVVVVEED